MSSNKNRAILIAEDDDDDFLLTQKAILACGFPGQVHRVKDGEELMEFLRVDAAQESGAERTLLLLLLDLNMPRKDGRQALREIKGHPDLMRIPIVILTTSGSEDDIAGAYGLGANSYIRKPASFDQFAEFIKALKTYWFDVAELPRLPLQRVS